MWLNWDKNRRNKTVTNSFQNINSEPKTEAAYTNSGKSNYHTPATTNYLLT